jgi:nitrite reductase/ring-hydroxylating ferredoxin subunit
MNLHLAGVYARKVKASLARIRENVLDWEHLPALHASSFAACTLVDTDADGWRIRLVNQPGDLHAAQVLKLFMADDTSGYRVVTEAGPGALSEIRVTLTSHEPHETGVHVEYHVPESDPARLAMIGLGFAAIYEHLWDEDEAMMIAREAALARRQWPAVARLDLGPEAEVRAALPRLFDFGPGRFRLVEQDGALIVHSAVCPHWLGPLEAPIDVEGCITCPWHGYRFDAITGRSRDGRALRLSPAPAISVDNGRLIISAAPLS